MSDDKAGGPTEKSIFEPSYPLFKATVSQLGTGKLSKSMFVGYPKMIKFWGGRMFCRCWCLSMFAGVQVCLGKCMI